MATQPLKRGTPLMPKATAVWLVENTTLTFEQIGAFAGLHRLEVQAIADGEVAAGIVGIDPMSNNQLTREEIKRGEADPEYRLEMIQHDRPQPVPRAGGPRYTPVAKRQDRPDAISWLLKFHPELTDSQISKLVGSTKDTVQKVRERTHWNSPNIKPHDPVTLGLCTLLDLNAAIDASRRKAAAAESAKKKAEAQATREAAAAAEAVQPQGANDAEAEPTAAAEKSDETASDEPTG